MLTLTDDVHFGRYIQPICLIQPDSSVADISNGYAVGYGKSEDETRVHENVLKFTETPINHDNEDCFYTNHTLLELSSKRTFCGGSRDGSGVCVGDSGNGLFVVDESIYYLRGIVSASLYTLNSCDVHNYAIFTNIIKFYDWINEKINPNRCSHDTIHYHIDNNSDNCDKIEITEYKNKARDAEMITNEAQRTADENSSQVDAAQQQVKDAQDKLEKALEDIQEAKQIAEEAENKAKEAIDVAAAAWTVVEETRIQEQNKTFVPVQKDISAEDQSNKIPKTATEAHEMAKIAQQEADAAQDELAEAEDSVSNAQDNAYEAKKALDSALKNLKDAQKEATGATNQANEIRTDAQQASRKVPGLQQNIQTTQRNLETSQKAIEAARKKANQMMEDVKAATILVSDALRRVNVVKISPDIINVVQAARERSEATKSFVNSLQSKVLNDMKNINQPLSVAKKMWEVAVSLSSDCNTIKRSADNAYRSSGNVKTKINNVKLSFDRSQNSYNHALNDLNDARVKRDSAKQKLTAAQARKEQLDEEARRMDEQESVEKETTTTAPRTTSKTSFTRGRTTTTKSSSTQPNRFVTTPKWVSQTTALPTSDSNESSHVDETEQKSEEEKCKMWYRFCKFGL